MVKYRYADSVQVQVTGPRSLLPNGPVTHNGRLGMTWLHFLTTNCGLRLDTDSEVYICTSTFSTLSPESGWTADLNDTMKGFIEKFSRKRSKYCVRLHTGTEPDATPKTPTTPGTTPAPVAPTPPPQPATSNAWIPNILRKSTPTTTAPVRKFASIIPLKPSEVSPTNSGSNSQNSTVRSPPTIFERPTPQIVIPTRGSQVVTPIQPVRPQQQNQSVQRNLSAPNGRNSRGRNETIQRAQKRPVAPPKPTSQNIPETSLIVGQPRAVPNLNAAGRRQQQAPQQDPSPPKLRRFDDIEPSSGANAGGNVESPRANGSNSQSQPRPGTSTAVPSAAVSPRKNRHNPGMHQFEEDSFPRIMTVMGGALKIEPVDFQPADEEIEDDEANVNIGFQTEEEIFNCLGIEVDGDEDDDEDDEGDVASMCTAADVQERELRNSGINVRDIKSQIDNRLDRFDNSMLIRIQNEIRKLKRTSLWDRNVKRSPLTCYLLTEIFKD